MTRAPYTSLRWLLPSSDSSGPVTIITNPPLSLWSGEEAPTKNKVCQNATMCEIQIRAGSIHVRCVYKKLLCKTRRLWPTFKGSIVANRDKKRVHTDLNKLKQTGEIS
jgi:hypothetical protein